MNKTLVLSAAVAAFLAVAGAMAAEPADVPAATGSEGTGSVTEEGTAASATPDPTMADDAATKAEKELEGDLALFWGERRKVKVVQKRMFQKDGRFELTAFGGTIPNDDFIVYYPLGLRAGYHFSEAFAIELSYAHAIDRNSDLMTFLEDDENIRLKRADLQEIIELYYNLSLLWAPIYGKISLLGLKLTHFEIYTGLGIGNFHTTEYPPSNPEGSPRKDKFSGHTVLGFRWFITDHINVRTDYRQLFFQKFDGAGGGGLSTPVELSVGVGVML